MKTTKVYSSPGYPIDPKKEEKRFIIISCDLCPNLFAVCGTVEQPILEATKAGWRVAHTEPNETKVVYLSHWCPECVSMEKKTK